MARDAHDYWLVFFAEVQLVCVELSHLSRQFDTVHHGHLDVRNYERVTNPQPLGTLQEAECLLP